VQFVFAGLTDNVLKAGIKWKLSCGWSFPLSYFKE